MVAFPAGDPRGISAVRPQKLVARESVAAHGCGMVDRPPRRPTARAPEAVAYVRDLLVGFRPSWFLCGGWAADAWLGRQTREHWDVDIGVFHDDQHAIFDHFPGWALVAHDPNVADDTTEPWDGRRLDAPAHIHVPRAEGSLATVPTAIHTAFEFEFLLAEGSGGDWLLNRELDIRVPLERGVRQSPWGMPAVAAEVILFFKAGGNPVRPQDEQDFFALLPILSRAQRSWLRESLGAAAAGHPWLTHLQA
jgi:hypothetical protein